ADQNRDYELRKGDTVLYPGAPFREEIDNFVDDIVEKDSCLEIRGRDSDDDFQI
ncbi:hypothetical protein FRC18_001461, partial [Serendipita sp. 400]